MKMKYIVVDAVFPIVFHPGLQHVKVAANKPVSSAGFVHINGDPDDPCAVQVDCFGESVSLDIKSDPESDTKLIKEMIEGYDRF